MLKRNCRTRSPMYSQRMNSRPVKSRQDSEVGTMSQLVRRTRIRWNDRDMSHVYQELRASRTSPHKIDKERTTIRIWPRTDRSAGGSQERTFKLASASTDRLYEWRIGYSSGRHLIYRSRIHFEPMRSKESESKIPRPVWINNTQRARKSILTTEARALRTLQSSKRASTLHYRTSQFGHRSRCKVYQGHAH